MHESGRSCSTVATKVKTKNDGLRPIVFYARLLVITNELSFLVKTVGD